MSETARRKAEALWVLLLILRQLSISLALSAIILAWYGHHAAGGWLFLLSAVSAGWPLWRGVRRWGWRGRR